MTQLFKSIVHCALSTVNRLSALSTVNRLTGFIGSISVVETTVKQPCIINRALCIVHRASFLLLTLLLSANMWGAEYEELFTITSDAVVTNSGYAKYETTVDEREWIITYGGNNKSVGTNKDNRSKCTLSSYSKYAVSPVTTSNIASAYVSKTSISDVSKISYTFNGGSNQTNTNVYLIYSSDGNTFSQVSLTSGTQGSAISSGTAYAFAKCSGYFGLLFKATNSSGNWRIDDVNITFYKEKAAAVPVTSLILSEAGNETDDKEDYNVGDKYPLPTETEATCGNKELVGWSEIEVAETNTKPTTKYYELGEEVTLGENNKFYAVFANTEKDVNNFAKGSVADLTNGQVVVIHDYLNNKVLTTEGYSSSTIPSASITPSNNKIPVSSITDKMKWTVGVVNGKYTFRQGSSYLMAANSYLKFGTTPQTQWTLTVVTNGYKFSQTDQTSYPYINYSSSKFDIASSSFSTLNVFVPAVTYSNYSTSCAPTYAVNTNNPSNGVIKFSTDGTNWSNSIADQPAGADVFFKLVPNVGYEVSSGTPTVSNVAASDIIEEGGVYLFTMPASAVTVSATFSCATPTFKTNLTEQTIERVQNVNALTLSVEKNESWATYQWQSRANNTDWENIASATGASYSPSIATIGTTYYRCLLKNGVSPCDKSLPSNVVTLVVTAPLKCETPTFSLVTGTYTGAKSVELSCVTEGAKIYYTTDGTAPSTLSTEYTGAINVFKTMTIRAIAAKDGIESSAENSISYTIQYTVTFAMQGHGSPVATQTVGYNDPVTDPQTQSITGWTFGGWFKEDACTNQWDFDTDKVAGYTTLFAKWTMTMFDVKFYNNGNELTEKKLSIQEGKTIGTLPTLTTTDAKDAFSKTFVGWTEEEVTTWQPQAPTPVTSTKVVEKELILNAVWAKGNVTMFDAADVSNCTEDEIYWKWTENTTGVILELYGSGSNRYTKNQPYTFSVDKNSYFEITSPTKITSMEVTYSGSDYMANNANPGSIATSGTTQTITSINATSTQIKSTSNQIRATIIRVTSLTDYITHSSASPLASVTLNTDNVKKIYFVGETFTSAGLTATATLDDGITFPIEYNALIISTPDLTTAGAKTVTVKYTFNNQEQSAQYTVNAYSVTINPVYTDRVGEESVSGNTYNWNEQTHTLTFTKQAHYQFNGISDVVGATPSGSNLSYTLSNPTANVTLTATWQRLFTVDYNSNGGSNVSSVIDVTKNTPINTKPAPTKTGYNLVGWYDNDTFDGDAVTFPYAITKDETLYAKWQVKTTTITFNQPDATTPGTDHVTATWNQPMPPATMPQREHYQFTGYTHNNITYYNADGISARNWDKEFATATLTAQWTPNKHNITLSPTTGGIVSISPSATTNVAYGTSITITATPATHYTLTTLTVNGADVKATKSFTMPDDNVTISATFTEDPKVTITFSDALHGNNSSYQEYVGDAIEFPTITDEERTPPTGDCVTDHYHFVGWTKDISKPNELVTQSAEKAPVTDITYHAVWGEEL
ncbi:MAG: InlB B-repeat-containing protein [Paludibacteraceae bacterium]|nr:InlB B-repeat-containing protein [Paludibacteraceae bacterium]